jgi:hypothetical protein
MSDPTPIEMPAGYAPAFALGFADSNAALAVVSDGVRLPVALAPAALAPLVGQTSVSVLAGPFEATAGRVLTVVLGGVWEGTVRLLRSIDGGTTRVPLRAGGLPWGEYTEAGCEQAWSETEDGASFYLDIALASGTLDYRLSQ